MEAQTTLGNSRAPAQAAQPPVPRAVLLMGLFLGSLAGGALWALQPPACAALCSVHGFLALAVAMALGLYVRLGRQEGARAGTWFAICFGVGVIAFSLVVSAARIATLDDDVMIEPMTMHQPADAGTRLA